MKTVQFVRDIPQESPTGIRIAFGYTDGVGLETTAEGLARVVADSVPDGMLVVDPAGVITLANHEIERQFGTLATN